MKTYTPAELKVVLDNHKAWLNNSVSILGNPKGERANLIRADLSGANLSGATGIEPIRFVPLLMMLDQPGKIRAYKLVKDNGEGPFNGGITYKVGKSYSAKANTDVNVECAEGINLATIDWCLKNWQPGYRILTADFTAKDIAAIPTTTDGKFRVHRCRISGEKDLKKLWIVS